MTSTASPASPARPTLASRLWFAAIVSMWGTFAGLALTSAGTLTEIWNWVKGLPVAAELLVWLAAFPGVIAFAVWESSWADWLRLALVLCFAAGWTYAFLPRPPKQRRRG